MERWVLPTRVVESLREEEASKLGQQSILSCPSIIARSGMVIVVVVVILLPTPWRGMALCHSAERDDTVGMAVVHLPSCAAWSCRGLRRRLLFY